ncbi:YhfC family intramembrane metalloprotease [Paenibacillus athensensis]|nr:YhfC family glutamic-type intramembrane protease [Paenibacillus athensensis]MCD1258664.1 YhfC family intramembrane metalloprotease [Paenibacillus athensensis]
MTISLFITMILTGLLCIALPLTVFVVLRRRLALRWGVFGIGMLTFFVSQVVLRLPWQIPLTKAAAAHGWTTGWSGVLLGLGAAVTAGVFEEGGRYLTYRWLVRRPTRSDAIALGLGHGGFESMALVGVSIIASGMVMFLVSQGALPLPADQAAALQPTLDKLAHTAWYEQLVALLERASAISFHVAMSALVYTAYVRRKWLPLWGALGLHIVLDGSAALLAPRHLWLEELLLAVVAAVCLWGLVRFWKRGAGDAVHTAPAGRADAPSDAVGVSAIATEKTDLL